MKANDIDFDKIKPDSESRPERCAIDADSDQFYGRLNFRQPGQPWPEQFCFNHPDNGPVRLEPSRGR